MESVGTALKRVLAELVVSRQKLRQTDGILLVRNNHQEMNRMLAFSSRP
jgi:hypothetical protein